MELNSNNREDVLNEAARVRKSRFLRMISRQFLIVPLYKPSASTTVSCWRIDVAFAALTTWQLHIHIV